MDRQFEYEKERDRNDEDRYRRTGVESYDQKLDRWKGSWRKEIEDDLVNGR